MTIIHIGLRIIETFLQFLHANPTSSSLVQVLVLSWYVSRAQTERNKAIQASYICQGWAVASWLAFSYRSHPTKQRIRDLIGELSQRLAGLSTV